MIITLMLIIITPYHSQAHIISCNSSKSWLFVSGFGCCILPHHYTTTTINPSLTHLLTHSLISNKFWFWVFLLVGYFFSFWFCLSLQQQASNEAKQTSKHANKQTSKQANKQVIKQSNSTAASKLSSAEPITRFLFYPFSSLQCSVPDFCEDLSKPHFS
jgi:hypothetical protein